MDGILQKIVNTLRKGQGSMLKEMKGLNDSATQYLISPLRYIHHPDQFKMWNSGFSLAEARAKKQLKWKWKNAFAPVIMKC